MTMRTRVPRKANARRPRWVLRLNKHRCPARAEVHGRTIRRANLASWVQPLPGSVDGLRPRDASARNERRPGTAVYYQRCRLATVFDLQTPPSLAATGFRAIKPVSQ